MIFFSSSSSDMIFLLSLTFVSFKVTQTEGKFCRKVVIS